MQRIAEDESRHYATLRGYTHQDVSPNRCEICFYVWLVRLLGVTFAVRRLELGEKETSGVYSQYPSMEHFAEMARDEQHHEEKLIEMIDEERLQYMGSVVLGLNDALVEFTGALAGFTLALNDTKLIALTGSITGIAAALSMASSEYLSTKSEKIHNKRPVKAAIYTGIAYIITVVALVGPFILLSSPVLALCIMLVMALLIIAFLMHLLCHSPVIQLTDYVAGVQNSLYYCSVFDGVGSKFPGPNPFFAITVILGVHHISG